MPHPLIGDVTLKVMDLEHGAATRNSTAPTPAGSVFLERKGVSCKKF